MHSKFQLGKLKGSDELVEHLIDFLFSEKQGFFKCFHRSLLLDPVLNHVKIQFNIIPHLRLNLSSGLFQFHFASKILHKFLGFYVRVTPPYVILFDLIFLIIFGEGWSKK